MSYRNVSNSEQQNKQQMSRIYT